MVAPIHFFQKHVPDAPVVLLGHGNGFPPEAYQAMMNAMTGEWGQVCLPARPFWDSTVRPYRTWDFLADDLIAGIEQHNLAPVVGLGHSMSGVAMLQAAVRRPELFRCLVMIDPVFLPPRLIWLAMQAKRLGLTTNRRLVAGAAKRRREWPSAEDAYQHFRQRSLFARCSDAVLRDYIDGITRPTDNGGVILAYSPEWEAQIFNAIPGSEWDDASHISVPCLRIIGQESNFNLPHSLTYWSRLRPDIACITIPEAGHLVPFEKPESVAQHSQQFFSEVV